MHVSFIKWLVDRESSQIPLSHYQVKARWFVEFTLRRHICPSSVVWLLIIQHLAQGIYQSTKWKYTSNGSKIPTDRSGCIRITFSDPVTLLFLDKAPLRLRGLDFVYPVSDIPTFIAGHVIHMTHRKIVTHLHCNSRPVSRRLGSPKLN